MRKVRAGVALATAGVVLTCAASAQAQRPPSLGEGAPSGQSGIQLYNFSGYLNNGAGELNPPAPTTTQGRLERVFQFLQAKGIKKVELYGYPGHPFPGTNPATPLNIAGLQALRALGDQYGLRFVGRHGNLTEANWDKQIEASKILGQDHIGEAGFPGSPGSYNTYAAALNLAQLLNRLGKRSVEAGLGPAYFHNHQQEFGPRYMDNGVLKSAWEVVMDHTDPRWVSAQIDIGWAVCGLAYGTPPDAATAQTEVTRLIDKYQRRIVSFHVKDMVNIRPTCGDADQRQLGLGEVNFAPMFAAAKNRVKYYLSERDPVAIGGPTNFNPFTNTEASANSLKSDPVGVLYAYPPTFAKVPAGTAAAANQVPVVVTNDGDAPLSITAVSLAANAEDGGNTTRDDFAIVGHNCTAAPLPPGGTCTVNVGFKPTRTNYTSVARLQFTSTSDDAMERVLLAGTSTGDAISTVGGNVPSMLALSLPPQPGSFGTFQPTVSKSYETAVAATVTSTAGDASLAVTDTGTTAPGHLVNGAFSLPSPLNVRALNAANPTQAYVPLAEATGAPTNLLTYSGPVNQDVVTLGFRQAIGATDVLRSGTYSKTLTFTLSTTAP
jgi:sugar phosphate isomerase/epimerase